ncbi:hypothetical protein AVEN_135514-1 [Araneus ventricosus]|uniref:Uncharacterized protein n=1 Tax=Araneus ventricosus TaxID=182803 RepID=A0A4Y2IHN3_ARAVE|nr:hypothetical protein AVEN_135514-1 [Araneus ventricosus]
MYIYKLAVNKFGKTTPCLKTPRICSAIKPRPSAVTLQQQRIVVSRGFLGLLKHSEKILVNDGWRSQYSFLRVFLIVYRSWDADQVRLQIGNISPTTHVDHQKNRALDRRVHLLRWGEIRNAKQVWDNNRAMLKSPKLLKFF